MGRSIKEKNGGSDAWKEEVEEGSRWYGRGRSNIWSFGSRVGLGPLFSLLLPHPSFYSFVFPPPILSLLSSSESSFSDVFPNPHPQLFLICTSPLTLSPAPPNFSSDPIFQHFLQPALLSIQAPKSRVSASDLIPLSCLVMSFSPPKSPQHFPYSCSFLSAFSLFLLFKPFLFFF